MISLRFALTHVKGGILRSLLPSTCTISSTRLQHSSGDSGTSSASCSDDLPIELDHNPYEKEKETCILCKYDITPDYKNVRLLSQFCSSYTGRVYGRHITRLCEHKQEQMEQAILRAQTAGFIAYMTKERTFLEDPQIFDPERPLRPHKH